jgi:hypothetical protein
VRAVGWRHKVINTVKLGKYRAEAEVDGEDIDILEFTAEYSF